MTAPAQPLPVLVAIPCFNEERTVAEVVEGFRRVLPEAQVTVYDNASTDRTALLAAEAGAAVVPVPAQGKGCVVREIFATSAGAVVVLVDGDSTYPPEAVRELLAPVLAGDADMTVGRRTQPIARSNLYRRAGNRVIVTLINLVCGTRLHDILSGYRVIGRSVLEQVSLVGDGFEVETELTAKAAAAGLRIVELPIEYGQRPDESRSKLRPVRDGARILRTAIRNSRLRRHRPCGSSQPDGQVVHRAP